MRWGTLFGWGIGIYATFFLLQTIFIVYGFVDSLASAFVSVILLVVLSFYAGTRTRLSSWKDIAPYSVTWAVIAAVLDGVLSLPYGGWTVYSNPTILIGYAIIVIAPLLAARFCLACSVLGLPCPIHAANR